MSSLSRLLYADDSPWGADWYKPCEGGCTFTHYDIIAERYAKITAVMAIDWSKVQWVHGGIPPASEVETLAAERTAFRIQEGLEVPTVVTDEDCSAICGHMDRLRG